MRVYNKHEPLSFLPGLFNDQWVTFWTVDFRLKSLDVELVEGPSLVSVHLPKDDQTESLDGLERVADGSLGSCPMKSLNPVRAPTPIPLRLASRDSIFCDE